MSTLLRCLVLIAGLLPALSHAAGMRVVPLKLDMTAKGGTATLEVTNLTTDNMGVQVEAKAWAQQAGADVYTDTQDLLFAPPIIAIPAGKTRTVRFRLRRAAAMDRELSYRVYVQQLAAAPDQDPKGAAMAGGVEVRLRLGIPLFVAAIKPAPPVIEASATAEDRGAIRLANPGAMHLKLMQVQVLDAGGKAVAETNLADTQTNYLLPGAASRWPLRAPGRSEPVTLAPGSYSLRIQSDYYSPRGQNGFSAEGIATRSLTVP